tara:strand:+ start:399 stop:1304 length:906 start_codon:yes stop_codon:yes gene_type:complete
MITLNSDRGFVKVESWKDIEELAGFTINLDPKKHELKEIIGRYIFKDYIKCGLSNCHTPHGKGYIVSTKSGPVTNIGHNCGKNHFDIEFDQLSKSFERDIALHNYRENIGSFLITSSFYKEEVDNIREGELGADNLFKKSQLLTRKTSGCPDYVVTHILKMVRSRNPNLIRVREASESETEELEAIQNKKLPRPYHIEENIGELKGLPFLYDENNLRKLIVVDLNEGLKFLSDLDIDNGDFKELKYWSSWCSDVERKIENIKSIVQTGITLLNKNNLLQLKEVLIDHEQQKEYIQFITKNM